MSDPMSDRLLALTDLIYDAASGGTPWASVGRGLERLVNAGSAALMAGDFGAGTHEILYHAAIPPAAVAAYQQHYRSVDLWTNRAARAAASLPPGRIPRVWTSGHLVPDSEFLRSEFYNDFGRRHGLRYVVGTVVHLGAAGVMPIGLHRPDGAPPFDPQDARLLQAVLPHLRRALQLRHQLRPAQATASATQAALDGLPVGAIVVDAEGQVMLANLAAEAIAASQGGIQLVQSRGSARGRRLALSACHNEETAKLLELIRRTASCGASGGALRAWNRLRTHAVAVFVSPLPRRLADAESGPVGCVPGRALVLLRDLQAAKIPPAAGLLRELFGLTAHEAEVARALYGGVTKEAVAAARGLRATTIKTQVDAILAKTGAANLRDLERLLGSLG
jgi:PAS domain-containing protein/DNA-binding CsgD family transcriptional regulator